MNLGIILNRDGNSNEFEEQLKTDLSHELRYLRYVLVNMSAVLYDSNQDSCCTPPVEIYWLHDNAAQDKLPAL